MAQNKPDYLLLLSRFCISTAKTRKCDNVRVAARTLVVAVVNVSSTGCSNERQSFVKLSYSAVDNVLTNLYPAGLHDFFQVLNVSNATTTVNKLLDCSPDGIVYWVSAWAIRRPLFWFHKFWHMKTHFLTDAFSYLHLLGQR